MLQGGRDVVGVVNGVVERAHRVRTIANDQGNALFVGSDGNRRCVGHQGELILCGDLRGKGSENGKQVTSAIPDSI